MVDVFAAEHGGLRTGMTLRQPLHKAHAKTLPCAAAVQHASSEFQGMSSTTEESFSKELTTRATFRWAARALRPLSPLDSKSSKDISANMTATIRPCVTYALRPPFFFVKKHTHENPSICFRSLPILLLPLCKQPAVDVSTDGK